MGKLPETIEMLDHKQDADERIQDVDSETDSGSDLDVDFESTLGPDVAEEDEPTKMSFREWFTDFSNLLKAFIGLNFMYISFAFLQAGLIRGIVGLLLITYITHASCLMLVEVKNSIPAAIREANKHMTYGDIARFAAGPRVEVFINAALVLTQFGYCTGYLIFLSHTVHDIIKSSLPLWSFVLLPLPLLGVIAQLRSVRSLGPFSTLANFSLMVGFVSVVAYMIKNFEWQPTNPSLLTFPLFFGQVTAALEGIGLVVPVETSMKDPRNFPTVLGLALFCLAFVLMTVGVLGFVTFGADTQSIILLNMSGSSTITVVKIVLCLGILFTYPLQLVPVVQSFEGWMAGGEAISRHVSTHEIASASYEIQEELERERRAEEMNEDSVEEDDANGANSPRHMNAAAGPRRKSLFATKWYEILPRLLIVFATGLVAVFAGKSFGLFQSLIGSLGAAVLAYSGPAYLHMVAFKGQLPLGKRLRNLMIISVGVLGTIIGTATTIREIVRNDPTT